MDDPIWEEVEHHGPEQTCDESESPFPEFYFEYKYCTCILEPQPRCPDVWPGCPTGYVEDPFTSCGCITAAEAEDLVDHGLGDDCLFTWDDQGWCEAQNSDWVDWEWNDKICQCASTTFCEIECIGDTPHLSPITNCDCIT